MVTSTLNVHYVKPARILHDMFAHRDRQFEETIILAWYLGKHPKHRMPRFRDITDIALTVAIAQELNHAHL